MEFAWRCSSNKVIVFSGVTWGMKLLTVTGDPLCLILFLRLRLRRQVIDYKKKVKIFNKFPCVILVKNHWRRFFNPLNAIG